MWSIVVIVLVGMPFYVVSQLQGGHPAGGTLVLSVLIFLAAFGGAWKKIQDARAKDAQKRFWLNQRK